jgi:hypothetical protein
MRLHLRNVSALSTALALAIASPAVTARAQEAAEPRAVEVPARIDRSTPSAEVVLRWTGPVQGTPVEVFVERLDRQRERFVEIAKLAPGERRYVDRGLNVGETYCYRVRELSSERVLLYTAKTCAEAATSPRP